jgi:penicillin-binding protein-related factor A (putative recombinase)
VANDGKDAEKAFADYWSRKGHCERFRDRRDLMGINANMRLQDFKKPSDFIVSSPSDPLHFAEVKSTKNKVSFSFNQIESGQHKAAILEDSRGSKAYIFYIFSYGTNEWYTMPCEIYAAAVRAGQKSVKLESLPKWNI